MLVEQPPLFGTDLFRILFEEFAARQAEMPGHAIGFGGTDADGPVAGATMPAALAFEFLFDGLLKNVGGNSLRQDVRGLSAK